MTGTGAPNASHLPSDRPAKLGVICKDKEGFMPKGFIEPCVISNPIRHSIFFFFSICMGVFIVILFPYLLYLFGNTTSIGEMLFNRQVGKLFLLPLFLVGIIQAGFSIFLFRTSLRRIRLVDGGFYINSDLIQVEWKDVDKARIVSHDLKLVKVSTLEILYYKGEQLKTINVLYNASNFHSFTKALIQSIGKSANVNLDLAFEPLIEP